jgi:ELWxxDGT repeat protein
MASRILKTLRAWIFPFTMFVSVDAQAGSLTLVRDIDPSGSSTPSMLEAVNGALYFRADDGVAGVEPWRSDGTEEGTVLVKDVHAGTQGSYCNAFTSRDHETIYFAADNGAFGSELWVSEENESNTFLLKDINLGLPSSWPGSSRPFTEFGSEHYFVAYTNAAGYELWKTDGTANGTVLLKDINPGPEESSPFQQKTVNGVLFFRADNGVAVPNQELWMTDGTEAGTVMVKEIHPTGASYPNSLTEFGGQLFFTADDGVHGEELWKSDGTPAGTIMVKDIRPSGSSTPAHLRILNGVLYFVANDGVNGTELWRSDGTEVGTQMAFDLNPSGSFTFGWLTPSGNYLYFMKPDGGLSAQLWRTDGTLGGTVMLRDFNPTTYHHMLENLTDVNGTLFFTVNDGVTGVELWKSDGTIEGTVLAADVRPGDPWSFSWPMELTNVNGILYFSADDGVHGRELWSYDNQTSTDVPNVSNDAATSSALVLHANVPNPFQLATHLSFDLAKASSVRVQIYDGAGRLVRDLSPEGVLPPGLHRVLWDGRDHEGRTTGAGVFAYRVQAGEHSESKLMIRVR